MSNPTPSEPWVVESGGVLERYSRVLSWTRAAPLSPLRKACQAKLLLEEASAVGYQAGLTPDTFRHL